MLDHIAKQTFGIYKAFVKWHRKDGDHTHVAVILREKPKLRHPYEYFTLKVGDLGDKTELKPSLVKPLGKGNSKPIKKLSKYVAYLVDGHDNGQYEDTWNYKYDHELINCATTVGRALCLMSRDYTYEQIYKDACWDERAKLSDKRKNILSAWRQFK